MLLGERKGADQTILSSFYKQDRVARRPHVLSCGRYCLVPCVILASQLQLDSDDYTFWSESCAMAMLSDLLVLL